MKPIPVLALSMLFLIVGACSPAAAPSVTPVNTAPPPSPTALPAAAVPTTIPTQGPPLKVPVAVGGAASLSYLPLDLAKTLKYFDAEGLNVDLQYKADAKQASSALMAGGVTLAGSTLEDAIKAQPQGITLKMLVSFARLPDVVVMVRADLKDSIKSAADFKGRKIGVMAIGGETHVLLAALAARAGLKMDDYRVAPVGGSTMASAFAKKEIDAGLLADPFATQLLKSGSVVPLADLRTQAAADLYLGGEFQSTGLLADASVLTNRRDTAQKMVSALVKAMATMRSHSARELAELLPDDVTGKDKQLWVDAYTAALGIYAPAGTLAQAGVENAVAAHRLFGSIKPDDRIDLGALYDNSFVEKAK